MAPLLSRLLATLRPSSGKNPVRRRSRRSRHPLRFLTVQLSRRVTTPGDALAALVLLLGMLAACIGIARLPGGPPPPSSFSASDAASFGIAVPALPSPTPDKVIYITFDDGPDPTYTPQVLDTLARHGAHATFFVLGRSVDSFFPLVERAHSEGHGIGNHSWNHIELAGKPYAIVAAEIQDTQRALGTYASTCFRAPFGSVDNQLELWTSQMGLTLVGWKGDTLDWTNPGVNAIVDAIMTQASDGAIVLLHDGGGDRSQTVAALDIVLDRLAGQGYRFEAMCRDGS